MHTHGFCATSQQWRDWPTRVNSDETASRCLMCRTAPTAIEIQGSVALRRQSRHAEGYCASCSAWLASDSWFELDQPLPMCPRCGERPSRLNYATAYGWRILPPDSRGAEWARAHYPQHIEV